MLIVHTQINWPTVFVLPKKNEPYHLPIMATSPQRPLFSVPKIAIVERFDCINLNTRYWQLIIQHCKLASCICTHLIDELQSTTEVVLHLKEFGLQ